MTRAVRIAAQVLLYGALMALVGTLSSFPRIRQLGDDEEIGRAHV